MVADFLIKYPKDGKTKTTIVVSKAVSKLAVERNRIRRIVKEALRSMGYTGGLTIIVKNNIVSLKMQELREKLEKCL